MQTETKICQNCKTSFVIEPEDFAFYEKMQVPPPTWCPECRMVRRMIWRNERTLYKRICDYTYEPIFSVYGTEVAFPVYKNEIWRSDIWDPLSYGTDYDFSRPFFEQFRELSNKVPRQSLDQKNAIDSPYTNFVANVKGSYLLFAAHDTENCYCTSSNNAFDKDCMDIMRTRYSEWCYEAINCIHCNHVVFSSFCEACIDSAFLYDCRNCTNCFGCVNLRNKSYCIFNKQYSRDAYLEKIKTFEIEKSSELTKLHAEFQKIIFVTPRKYARIIRSINVSGDDIADSKNCHFCFFSQGAENCKYGLTLIDGARDIYDVTGSGVNAELNYESVSALGQRILFSSRPWYDHDLFYCDACLDSQYLFACIGLRNKSYCILNKQYTKEEYEALVPKIIDHMNAMPYTDAKGRIYKYGEFFPPELSPFCYNETIAQEYFPLTKEQATEKGYRWKDPEERNIAITIQSQDLPDHIKDAPDDIVNQIIGCAHASTHVLVSCNEQCTEAFKIIPQELEFYRKMNLPLPRFCPNCRHYQRLKQRNPLKLWHRRCACLSAEALAKADVYRNTATHRHGSIPCMEEFETSYAPERQEIVYCEACYNQEVA